MPLLAGKHPWLSPMEAGTDFGRDCDIYEVTGGDTKRRGRILATTGDILSNLKRSHKSRVKKPTSSARM